MPLRRRPGPTRAQPSLGARDFDVCEAEALGDVPGSAIFGCGMSEIPASAPDPLECTRCGACCFSESPRHARVTGDDYERLGDAAEWLVEFIGHQAFMRLEPVTAGADLHRCAALVVDSRGGRFSCSVYDRRPQVCRDLERGSPACAGERATKGDRPVRSLSLVGLPDRR